MALKRSKLRRAFGAKAKIRQQTSRGPKPRSTKNWNLTRDSSIAMAINPHDGLSFWLHEPAARGLLLFDRFHKGRSPRVNMNSRTRNVPPRASAMLESLRGLGYNPATALADIVDNSVSAGATKIDIQFDWSGDAGGTSRVAILDNGRGMSDAELESAMTLGDKSPLDARAESDLGRFGMGLKTASFSQCRRLTVASVKEGARSCLRWDLDALMAHPAAGWVMFEGPAAGSEKFLDPLDGMSSGTLVLWEALDRIVTASYLSADFAKLTAEVDAHLAMVFHRLICGPSPRFRLTINGNPVVAWVPFMTDHPAKTWSSPDSHFPSPHGPIAAQGHVLPHKDMLLPDEFRKAEGPEGWTAQQGFYVYRNERLLVAGGWLGLGQGKGWVREEFHRLARIRLDIPNTADADWKIDIRKSSAKPPVLLRPWLVRLAEDARGRARKVFAYRASPTVGPRGIPVEQAWRVEHLKGGVRYKIDERHPAISAALEASGQPELVRAMLRVIEETVPVQRIWLDTAEDKETPRTAFAGDPPEAVVSVLRILYADMIGRQGISPEDAKRSLARTEPFQNYQACIDDLQIDESGASPKEH